MAFALAVLGSYAGRLTVSSPLGGTGWDGAFGVARAADGSIFVAGETGSPDFRVRGGFQETYGGGSADAFLLKIGPNGEFEWGTFLGGSARDYVWDVAAMPNGDAVIVGSTHSPNFPTLNAFQGSPGGAVGGILDGFVARFDGDGRLILSSYAGGDDWDEAASVAAAPDGTAWITGWTSSSNFPQYRALTTLGSSCRRVVTQCPDAFLFGVRSDGELALSTYIGGTDADRAQAIAVSGETGEVVVAGFTRSPDFPTVGGVQPAIRRGSCRPSCGDAFIVKIDPEARTTSLATFLGGEEEDRASAVAIGPEGSIVVAGRTRSDDLGLHGIGGVYRAGCTEGDPPFPCFDAFAAILSSDGTAVTFGTYLGGTFDDRVADIAVGADGAIALVGSTQSSDFPVAQPVQGRLSAGMDAFLAVLSPPNEAPVFSTYLGGRSIDEAAAVVWGGAAVWMVGSSESDDFPQRQPLQPGPGGDMDAFIAQVQFDPPSATPSATATPTPIGHDTPVTATMTSTSVESTAWLPALHR